MKKEREREKDGEKTRDRSVGRKKKKLGQRVSVVRERNKEVEVGGGE